MRLFTSGPVLFAVYELYAVYAAHADLQHQLHVARTRSGHAACRRTRSSRVFESMWLWGRRGLRGSAAVHHKRVYALCPSQENICLVSITAEYMPCVHHIRTYAFMWRVRARAHAHVHIRTCIRACAHSVQRGL